MVDVHALVLYLFAQLYTRSASRPGTKDIWPSTHDSIGGGAGNSGSGFHMQLEPSSPVRMSNKGSSAGGRCFLAGAMVWVLLFCITFVLSCALLFCMISIPSLLLVGVAHKYTRIHTQVHSPLYFHEWQVHGRATLYVSTCSSTRCSSNTWCRGLLNSSNVTLSTCCCCAWIHPPRSRITSPHSI